MKDYNEMAEAVFRRRDEFVAARKKRNGIIVRTGASLCALLVVAVVGISVWKALPEIPVVPPTEPETTVTEQTYTTGTNEAEDTKPQIDVTESDKNTDPVEKPTDNTKPEGNKKPDKNETTGNEEVTLPQDPTETQKPDAGDTPSAGFPTVTLPQDPTEATENGDIVEDTTAPSHGLDPTEATLPEWTMTPETVPCTTASPMETVAPETTSACEVDPDCTLPYATEPLPESLFIECDGKTYEAQVGDMVTLTVELQADEKISDAWINVIYDHYQDMLKAVKLQDYGFTQLNLRKTHFPNVDEKAITFEYIEDTQTIDGNVKVNIDFSDKYGASMDFVEKKVFCTFSFMVMKPGNTKIELVRENLQATDGDRYFYYDKLVNHGAEFTSYLTVVPAEEIQIPTPPERVVPEDFTYPEESAEGDLIINCDGRKYSADIGDIITFVTELEAEVLFENIHIILDYPEENLTFNTPKKSKEVFPNMHGQVITNYVGFDVYGDRVGNYAVVMVASDIDEGYDFTKRKILAQLEFEVKKAGEIDLDLYFRDMTKYYMEDAYFERGNQRSFEDIQILQYIVTDNSAS